MLLGATDASVLCSRNALTLAFYSKFFGTNEPMIIPNRTFTTQGMHCRYLCGHTVV